MTILKAFWLAGILMLAACTEQTVYPLSGEDACEGDPVQTLEAADCTPGAV